MTYNKKDKMSGLEALKELKENAQEVCKWELDRLNIIEKDLEILYMLRKNMHVDTETLKDDDNKIVEYEYISYNYWELDIENKEEYNKIKEWLQNDK